MNAIFTNKLIKAEIYSNDKLENNASSLSAPSSSLSTTDFVAKVTDNNNLFTSSSTIFSLHHSMNFLATTKKTTATEKSITKTTAAISNNCNSKNNYSSFTYFNNNFNQSFNIWDEAYSINQMMTPINYNYFDDNNNNNNIKNLENQDYYNYLYSTGINNQLYRFYDSCKCIIDVSTPATLERDFYAWLNVIYFF